MTVSAITRTVLSGAVALHPFYLSRPRLWSSHLREIDARIALSLEKKYCYVRVPKAANTSVTSTLYYHEHGKVPDRTQAAKRSFRRPSGLLRSVPVMLDHFFCFTFVRNPYDRILSAYLSKLVAGEARSPYRQIGSRIRRTYGEGELSFNAFCAYLDSEGPYGNPHWYPQCDFVDAILPRRLDVVGKVESINEDMARVTLAVFGRADGRIYVRGFATGASDKVAEYYDAATRAIVRRLYREDFDRFGYEPG